jgi:hypothetical protein
VYQAGKIKNNLMHIQYNNTDIRILFLFILVLQACSCNDSENVKEANTTILKEYHEGRYGKGILFKEKPIVDGKIHGIYKSYYVSGRIMIEKKFYEGKERWTKIYSQKGQLEEFRYTLNDAMFSSAFFYYENGDLRKYTCHDYNGNLFYIVEYDKNRVMFGQMGRTMCIPKIEKKDSVYISFPYANPPKSYVKVTIEYDSFNQVEIEAKDRIVSFSTDSATLAKGFFIDTKLYSAKNDHFVFGSKVFVNDTLSLKADLKKTVKIYLEEE